VDIGGESVPSVIDEFPIICVLASQAEGTSTIRGAGELRVKESDRVMAMAGGLRRMGVEVKEHGDGIEIRGVAGLKGAHVESHGDHRIAMAFSIAALAAHGATTISDSHAVDISFPGFFDRLRELAG
jgi:3-phosphoshikimate 1-carboxyvinyltransferase